MPDTAESLIRQAIHTLTVPAAEYCPAIPDAWAILERALAALAQPAPTAEVALPAVSEEVPLFEKADSHGVPAELAARLTTQLGFLPPGLHIENSPTEEQP